MLERQFKDLSREEIDRYYNLVQRDPIVSRVYHYTKDEEGFSTEQVLLHTIIELVKIKDLYIEECVKLQERSTQSLIYII